MSDILDAALEYAQNGFAVIPVRQSDKSPYNLHGVSEASKDPEQIRQWWEMYPTANVAIAMGRVSGNIVTIDVDIKPDEGKHGDVELKKWEAQHGNFPNTVIQVTGSGGLHYIFHMDGIEKYKNTVDAIPAIDVRGDGAYIVVSPSVYADGRTYRWYNDVSILDDEIADANKSVIDLLELNKRDEKKRSSQQQRDVIDVAKGSRNQTIFKYAASQSGYGVPFEITLNSAMMLNNGWSDPLDDNEVLKTVKSAYKYEPNEKTIYSDTEEPEDIEAPTLEEYEEQEVEWLVDGYIPRGQITIFCGDGGVGKTSVWASVLADLSAGRPTIFDVMSGRTPNREPMKLMFFSGEDTIENVIKKKLRAAKANMRNIRSISLSSKNFEKIVFGSKELENLYAKYKPDLCVFDPLQSFIGEKIKMVDRNAMRNKTRPLIEWGSLYGTATLLVMHTNKQSNVWARQRMADSADLWDIARSVLLMGEADGKGMKYISHEKSNYGSTSKTILFTNDTGLPVVYSTTDKKDRDFVLEASKKKNAEKDGSSLQEVCNFILSELSSRKEGMIASELDTLLKDIGYNSWSIRNAKQELKKANLIKYEKPKEMGGHWVVKIR